MNGTVSEALTRWFLDRTPREGQAMVEYALLMVLCVIVTIPAVTALRAVLQSNWWDLVNILIP